MMPQKTQQKTFKVVKSFKEGINFRAPQKEFTPMN